ncbi:MAG: hypothetical protein ACREFD_02305 [Stellaceae bacterium]
MELAVPRGAGASRRLTMAAVSHVFTITRVAEMLGENEEWLEDISIEMDPEDGRLTVLGPGEESTTSFTDLGVENLAQIVKIYKADPHLARYPKTD